MRRILLREYERSAPVGLAPDEVQGLRRLAPNVRVEPSLSVQGFYELTPESHVGIVRLGHTIIDIRPKFPLDRFFFILSYGVDPAVWRPEVVPYDLRDSLLEAVAPAFRQLVARATRLGLLHGYRTEEEALSVVRGQIRFRDQMERRYGRVLPVEVRFDEFTPDITENRILLAALHRLSRLPLRSQSVRRGLHEIIAAFHSVSPLRMGPSDIPAVSFNRLNEHYEPAVRLAAFILKCASLEVGDGQAAGTCFLVDMNEVFEAFVHRALRESLHLGEGEFPRGRAALRLDEAGSVRLVPDLSWWRAGECVFVGDAKYKRVGAAGVTHPDLYQLLAYLTAAGLSAGMLIYAAGAGKPARHRVRHAGKTLIVESLDISRPPDEVLAQIQDLAHTIRVLADAPHAEPQYALGRHALQPG